MAKAALAAGRQGLSDYPCPKSCHTYTQPQLFACLVLKQFFKLDCRVVVTWLSRWKELRDALGLARVPHYSTQPTKRTAKAQGYHSGRTWRQTFGFGWPTNSPPLRKSPSNAAKQNPFALLLIRRCSPYRPGWCGFSTATCSLQESASVTNAAGLWPYTLCGTLLSKGNVAPQTAQAAMRHSSIDLNDERIYRPAIAVRSWSDERPAGPAPGQRARCRRTPKNRHNERHRGGAKNTYDKSNSAVESRKNGRSIDKQRIYAPSSLGPMLARTFCESGKSLSNAGTNTGMVASAAGRQNCSQVPDKQGLRQPCANAVNPSQTGRDRTRTCDFFLVREAL